MISWKWAGKPPRRKADVRMKILIGFGAFLLTILLAAAYGGYRYTFFSRGNNHEDQNPADNPYYAAYREVIRPLYDSLRNKPYQLVSVQSHDGLTLWGRYYPGQEGAPLAICFHGYRSNPIRDFCGGADFSFQMGYSVLLVDERAHGRSQGHTVTFGIEERWDVQTWVQFALKEFGWDTKILLYGISMGASAVLMVSGLPLPANVKGIIADCPYAVPMEIICHVAKKMHLPRWLTELLIPVGARLYGHFDIFGTDAVRAVQKTNIPILILHGESDGFVPCAMSEKIQMANPGKVERHTFPGAEHGISFLVDTSRYVAIVKAFINKALNRE